ncbi:MAG: TauD/TfdA family dioxygenase [Myxococcales bacterium]|nr:TauD/TfdA family dioxygenase [Myxococcales bacterium]
MHAPTPEFIPLAGALGAEVRGLFLGDALDDATLAALRAGLAEHQVLVFRGQAITPEQQRAFAARFGVLQPHPAYPTPPGVPEVSILEHTAEKPSLIEAWHTDMTFMERPPLGSILRGCVLPARGGDTLWASQYAAYEALSAPMRAFLDGLQAEHDFSYGFKESLALPGGRERLAAAVAANPPRVHPVVRTHPESGRKALFVNPLFTTRILGLTAAESAALLAFLYAHAVADERTFRLTWAPDTVAFWDNRCTLHKPVNDHGLQHRLMQRVVIEGDRPR